MTFSIQSSFQYFFMFLGLALFSAGCEKTKTKPTAATEHSHDAEHSHNHDHDNNGPRFGGHIVDVGHAHNPDGLVFFFAEILPVKENSIRLYISVENENGEAKPAILEDSSVMAYVYDSDSDTSSSKEVAFTLKEKQGDIPVALLTSVIPTILHNSGQLSVIVPKITLGGERLNFTFNVSPSHLLDSETSNESDEAIN